MPSGRRNSSRKGASGSAASSLRQASRLIWVTVLLLFLGVGARVRRPTPVRSQSRAQRPQLGEDVAGGVSGPPAHPVGAAAARLGAQRPLDRGPVPPSPPAHPPAG